MPHQLTSSCRYRYTAIPRWEVAIMGRAVPVLLSLLLLVATVGCSAYSQPSGSAASASGQAASAGSAPAERTSLKVAYVPVLAFGPLYRAMEKGYFTDAGLDIDLTV